jgi:hypothetical protein
MAFERSISGCAKAGMATATRSAATMPQVTGLFMMFEPSLGVAPGSALRNAATGQGLEL